jgi:long-chain-fatty-acid---luciferin-component ligase
MVQTLRPQATSAVIRAGSRDTLDAAIYEGVGHYSSPPDRAAQIGWLAQAAERHIDGSPIYSRLAARQGFTADALRSTGDLSLVPVITASTFKRRTVYSTATGSVRETRSSGTQGTASVVLRDEATLERFIGSVSHGLREFHGESSVREAFVLSPPANEVSDVWFSYVLTLVELVYDTHFFVIEDQLRPDELVAALAMLDESAEPIIVAPPALLADALDWMDASDTRLDLAARSPFVLTAGGWKRRASEEISRPILTSRVEERLGIAGSAVRDVFNMVELNTVLFECEHHAKHVPPWLAVLVRRPRDLTLASSGELGIVSFLDPTATSYPAFVLSDDLGAVSDQPCPCGRSGPTLHIERRLARVEERGCGLKLERYGSHPKGR